jgi:hypothetical protein
MLQPFEPFLPGGDKILQPLLYMEGSIFRGLLREIMRNLGQCNAYLML